MNKRKLDEHERLIKKLNKKKEIAELKHEEWILRFEILRTYLPFLGKQLKFKKLIVCISIAVIVLYTIAAILLQKTISIEISPTLTTCVFAFFGTELFLLAGIKVLDKNGTDSTYYLD